MRQNNNTDCYCQQSIIMKSMITQLQNVPTIAFPPVSGSDDIDDLKQTQQTIQNHINKLAELNLKFHKRQEESFLITFADVMDRMSEELLKARRKYQNIDIEVKKSKIYNRLEEELDFYKQDNAELRRNINVLKLELNVKRQKNEQLKLEVTALKNRLRSKSLLTNRNTALLKKHKGIDQELDLPEISFTSTVKKVFFRPEDRVEQNHERKLNNTSLNMKRVKDTPSIEKNLVLPTLQCQIQQLWKQSKRQYPKDMTNMKPKIKERLLESFVSSLKVKELLKGLLLTSEVY